MYLNFSYLFSFRFIAPLADDYHVDHISVLSQSDFSGRVVNNDHFLYWGDIVKTNDEGMDFHIQVAVDKEDSDDEDSDDEISEPSHFGLHPF